MGGTERAMPSPQANMTNTCTGEKPFTWLSADLTHVPWHFRTLHIPKLLFEDGYQLSQGLGSESASNLSCNKY